MRPAVSSFVLAVVLTGLLVGASGCSGFTTEEPGVPDSTMTRVFVEMHVAAARAEAELLTPDGITDSILTQYGVRRDAYEQALDFYSRHPEDLETLYNTVIDSLRSHQGALRNFSPKDNPNLSPDSTDRGTLPEKNVPDYLK